MDKEYDGVWAVVICEGKRYFGRVNGYVEVEDDGRLHLVEKFTLENERLQIICSEKVKMFPVLDYISIDQPQASPGQDGALNISMMRTPVVMPFDYTVEPAPVFTKPTTIFFFDDMGEKSKAEYEKLREEGFKRSLSEAKSPLIERVPAGTRLGPAPGMSRPNGR